MTYRDQLNVSESCDLSEHSNTNAPKCQQGADKFFQGIDIQKYQSFL